MTTSDQQAVNEAAERPITAGLYLVSTCTENEPHKVARWVGDHWRTVGDRIDDDNRIPDGRIARWSGPLVVAEHAPEQPRQVPAGADDGVGIDAEWLSTIGEWNDEMAAFGVVILPRQHLWLRVNGQWWLTCDSIFGGRFCSHKRLKTHGDVLKLLEALGIPLRGDGRTDMTLAIVEASKQKPRPDIVLCVTDGYTAFPDEPTDGVPVVAIIVSDGTKSAPNWIDQVVVPHIVEEEELEEEAGTA